MVHSKRFFSLAALFAAAIVCACAGAPQPTPPAAPGGAGKVDDLGRSVPVAARPARIVSLAPNLTEIVFAVGAGDRLVADTSYCDYPPEAREKVRVGDTQRPDVERIVALKPDVVLVSTASQLQDIIFRFERVGVPTYVSDARDLEGVIGSVARLGALLGEEARGEEASAALRARVEAVRARVAGRPAPKVFMMVGDRPLITTGRATFMNDLITRAGGVSISADEESDWPQYSPEAVVARAPDVIVIPVAGHGVESEQGPLPEGLRETPAFRNGRVVRIDADVLMRPGPRLVDGLERLAEALHPETAP